MPTSAPVFIMSTMPTISVISAAAPRMDRFMPAEKYRDRRIGTAITNDNAIIPIIEPNPNSAI